MSPRTEIVQRNGLGARRSLADFIKPKKVLFRSVSVLSAEGSELRRFAQDDSAAYDKLFILR